MSKNKINEIAIIQLDGIEALLLSIPAVHGVRQRYPEANISFFAAENCKEIQAFFPHINQALFISGELLPAEVQTKQFDLTVNLSYCDAGIDFSSQLSSIQRLGPTLNAEKETDFPGVWCKYFESTVGKSELNPFHRSDIYKKIAQVADLNCEMQLVINKETIHSAKKLLAEEDHLKVGISLEKLNSEDIAKLVRSIQTELPLTKFYLLGSLKNKSTAKDCMEALGKLQDHCIDLTGRLSQAETIALSAALDIVVSHDPILCHYASGFGTLSIALDNKTTPNTDSYVYNDGHLVVRSEGERNYAIIIEEILKFVALNTSGLIPNQNDWKSFGADLFDKLAQQYSFYYIQRAHETNLVPLLYMGAEAEECLRSVYKLLWLHELEGKNEAIYGLEIFHESTLSKLTKLLKPLEQLYELAAFGQKYCAFIKKDLVSKNLEHTKDYTGKLQEVDDLVDWMANSHQDLIPIINYFEVSMSQIRSKEPVAVAVETTKNYLALQNHVLILLELTQNIFAKIQKLELENESAGV